MSDKDSKIPDDSKPCTSRSADKKSSKTRLEEIDDDRPLDLSIKKQRTSQTFELKSSLLKSIDDYQKLETDSVSQKMPILLQNKQLFKTPFASSAWGSLLFYENSKIVLSYELWNYDPIKITAKTLLTISPKLEDNNSNYLINYTDWEHVIGDGFILKRRVGERSTIEMQRLDSSPKANKYKVFLSDKEISVTNDDIYEIYDGNTMLAPLENVKNIREAYKISESCYLTIAIYGDFMKATGPLFGYDKLNKNMMPSYPYWFMLKLNPEYFILDKHAKTILQN